MRFPTPSLGEPVHIPGFGDATVFEVYAFDDVTKDWLIALENDAILTIRGIGPDDAGYMHWEGVEPIWSRPVYMEAYISDEEMEKEEEEIKASDVITFWLEGLSGEEIRAKGEHQRQADSQVKKDSDPG